MPRRLCVSLLAGACLLIAAPAARAGWYPSEAVDGPADITALGGVDIARDGVGGVAYIKRDGGVPHVFVSRIVDGAFQAPERVDVGSDAPATEVAIAAADDRRLVVAWIAGNTVYGSFAPGGSLPPLSPPQPLAAAASGVPTGIDVDMGINGTAYVTYALPGGGGSDVGAARLQGTTWEAVPGVLDINQADNAGAGSGRPRVAVSAEGYAVVTWGEAGSVVARRVTGLNLSVAPQTVSVPSLDGAAGGLADSPDIDIEDDGSFAWVVFRQDIGGVSNTLARRLVGSQFEAPAVIGGPGATAPAIAEDERGVGQAVSVGGDSSIVESALTHDAFGPPAVASQGAGAAPQVAVSERQDSAVAWIFGAGQVAGRYAEDAKPLGPPALLSTPDFGAVPGGALRLASDRAGDMAAAMLQGDAGARRLTVAVYDRPPGIPYIYNSTRFQKRKRPVLKFRAGLDVWGTPTYNVLIDRVLAGSTHSTAFQVVKPLSEGAHRLRIVQVDRRGQTSVSRERFIRVDTAPPRLRVRISGKRKRGSTLKISASASDGKGSGMQYVEIDFGDKSPRVRAARASHRYRAGKFTLTVKAVDKVGNVARRTVKLRIKK
jgi:hypothetical protein